jgi:hypothetical protein
MQGRVDTRTRAAMDDHADACARCDKARARVTSALRLSGTFDAIRKESSPELGWDSIRAKVHWEVSSELRASRVRPRPALAIFGARLHRYRWALAGLGGAALAAAGVVGVLAMSSSSGAGDPVASIPPAPTHEAPAPASLVGTVSRFSGDVMIDGIRRPSSDAFERSIGPGATLATADGRVDVQFGDASALSLAPRSTLELRKFDSAEIELVVDGTVDIEVAPRAAGQHFVVRAGDQIVEVRGTQFRVTHDAHGTHVACRHGLVAVRDSAAVVEVAADRAVEIPAGHPVTGAVVKPVSPDEAASLVASTPVHTPSPVATVPLDLLAASPRAVRVDGVELGSAPMRVRVTPGRHLVEVADAPGRFRRLQWITADAATPLAVKVDVPVEGIAPPRPSGTAERRTQFLANLDRGRLGRCVRAIVKDGITDLFVQIEIGVAPTGDVTFLNVVDSGDLDAATTACVRDVLADVRFVPGAEATWRERIGL